MFCTSPSPKWAVVKIMIPASSPTWQRPPAKWALEIGSFCLESSHKKTNTRIPEPLGRCLLETPSCLEQCVAQSGTTRSNSKSQAKLGNVATLLLHESVVVSDFISTIPSCCVGMLDTQIAIWDCDFLRAMGTRYSLLLFPRFTHNPH